MSVKQRNQIHAATSGAQYDLLYEQWKGSGQSKSEFATDRKLNYLTMLRSFKRIEAESKAAPAMIVVGR